MDTKELLKTYCEGADRLYSKMNDVSDELLVYRPQRPDAWTIKEHVIHLVDSEMNGFIRLKSIIAQPDSTCYVMDEERWTRNIRRKNEDIKKYLAMYGLVKEMAYDFLADEPEENWNDHYYLRTYNGTTDRVTIAKCLKVYIDHLEFHLRYIEMNIEAYRNEHPAGEVKAPVREGE